MSESVTECCHAVQWRENRLTCLEEGNRVTRVSGQRHKFDITAFPHQQGLATLSMDCRPRGCPSRRQHYVWRLIGRGYAECSRAVLPRHYCPFILQLTLGSSRFGTRLAGARQPFIQNWGGKACRGFAELFGSWVERGQGPRTNVRRMIG